MRKKTVRHCACKRVLRQKELLSTLKSTGLAPKVDHAADPIKARLIPLYETRAALGLPLFDSVSTTSPNQGD